MKQTDTQTSRNTAAALPPTRPRRAGHGRPLLLCLSHLRWDFVFQRPQHLMTRAAATYDVLYLEEPTIGDPGTTPRLDLRPAAAGVEVACAVLPPGMDAAAVDTAQQALLGALLESRGATVSVAWFYTPMAFDLASGLDPAVTIYDSMDELSLFRGASPRLALLERRLLRQADLVFAGGRSLFAAKRHLHPGTHLFPSAVDQAHFARARQAATAEPADQAAIPFPRIGFFGVIDERMDYDLVADTAALRPDWQFVMVGPTAKVDPRALPRAANLHWLGSKAYAALPAYLSGWQAGWMPFALNEATRFISPTKTPEFLAAGVPVVSTAVPDVVADWGQDGSVGIAADAPGLAAALERVMAHRTQPWLDQVDQRLARVSWDATWARMHTLIAGLSALEEPLSEPG